jgi:hypothetical protein
MRSPYPRLLAISLLALTLGSCSYGCDILAVVIGGRLAFIVDPASEWQPDCIYGISVEADKGEPKAEPEKTDDRLLVTNGGLYWDQTFAVTSCENRFPIFYGAPLQGPPFVYNGKGLGSVAAKPLRVGALYHVTTSGDGGYGNGWFRIMPDWRVENLRDDPTPAVTNEQGYDITDYGNHVSQAEERTYSPRSFKVSAAAKP